TATSGNFGECTDLFEYGISDCLRGQFQFQAAEIRAIGIAGMGSDGQLPSLRLFDGGLHGSFVARVPTAGDVDRSDRWHQCFLRAVRNRLGQFTHIAIQVHSWMSAVHSEIKSSEASSFSCSLNRT